MTSLQRASPPMGASTPNFILRRALPYVTRAPTREWQEAEEDDYENSSTLPDKQPQHKTVIYFGDTNPRKAKVDDNEVNKSVVEVQPPQSEIVISVKPSRVDVMRIEEDETKLEDYWSLPGDTTGFKADWSFVQQWRLRG